MAASIRADRTEPRLRHGVRASAACILFPFLQKIGPADSTKLRQHIVAGLEATLPAITPGGSSLQDLQLDNIAIYNKRATEREILINPNKG